MSASDPTKSAFPGGGRATRPGVFGPVNTCCGVTASEGHGLYCENGSASELAGRPISTQAAAVGVEGLMETFRAHPVPVLATPPWAAELAKVTKQRDDARTELDEALIQLRQVTDSNHGLAKLAGMYHSERDELREEVEDLRREVADLREAAVRVQELEAEIERRDAAKAGGR